MYETFDRKYDLIRYARLNNYMRAFNLGIYVEITKITCVYKKYTESFFFSESISKKCKI